MSELSMSGVNFSSVEQAADDSLDYEIDHFYTSSDKSYVEVLDVLAKKSNEGTISPPEQARFDSIAQHLARRSVAVFELPSRLSEFE